MASDNIVLAWRKKRYEVFNYKTSEVYERGFTSQKSACAWARENLPKGTDWMLNAYIPKVNK